MRLKDLIKDLSYKKAENLQDAEITGVGVNSHTVSPGYLFVAVKGERLDGHNFVPEAIAKGARAVVIEKDLPLSASVAKIVVADTRAALIKLCAAFFEHPAEKLNNVGITGTNGKTTVSYLIETMLGYAGYKSGVIGTINYRVAGKNYPATNTTPGADILHRFLREIVSAQAKYAIIEVSSHALEQKRTSGIRFQSAIFTNLSAEHLDYHKTMANYFTAKARLFRALDKKAWAIVNTDDAYGRKLVKITKAQVLTYGLAHVADIQAQGLTLDVRGSRFTVRTPQGSFLVNTPLIGEHNIYNILAAIGFACAEHLDMTPVLVALKSFNGTPGRLERVECGQDFAVFIDYAHTDAALKIVLDTVRRLSPGRVIVVFGCGGDRDKQKRPRMGKVATERADSVIITCDNPRSEKPEQIVNDILKGISAKKHNYTVVLDRYAAIREALTQAEVNDVVVIAGKGHENVQIFAERTVAFSDRSCTEEILKCLPLAKS
ncbi:MAG: UDP-N-acetylmuramoyl-L-alanyl-D-glutamate--2,6-diaminopimelate ligase [Candidatus Omnitrophota bacterium]